MSEKLVATVEQRRGGASLIKLAGVIDEHNQLDALSDQVGGKTLINLSGVVAINSYGMRDWMSWIASLEQRGITPELVACSPAVVAQLNLVKNFAGHGVVKTLQVPYRCETCRVEKLVLVTVADLGKRPKAPEQKCDGCAAAMTFVDETGEYFNFVAELARRPPPKSDSFPPQQLARGSDAAVGDGDRSTQRRMARPSASYLSAAAVSRTSSRHSLPIIDRTSQRRLQAPPSAMRERVVLISIVSVLVATLGVLVYLLIA